MKKHSEFLVPHILHICGISKSSQQTIWESLSLISPCLAFSIGTWGVLMHSHRFPLCSTLYSLSILCTCFSLPVRHNIATVSPSVSHTMEALQWQRGCLIVCYPICVSCTFSGIESIFYKYLLNQEKIKYEEYNYTKVKLLTSLSVFSKGIHIHDPQPPFWIPIMPDSIWFLKQTYNQLRDTLFLTLRVIWKRADSNHVVICLILAGKIYIYILELIKS